MGPGTCSTKIFNRQCYRPVEEGEQAPTRPPKVVIPKVSSSELKFQELCREAKKNNFNHITIESVAELGANYEEITANLEVIRKQRIYFRIL